jgi:hypothetical protein
MQREFSSLKEYLFLLQHEQELIPTHKKEVRLRRRTSSSIIHYGIILNNCAEPHQEYREDFPQCAVPRKQQLL